MTIKECMENFLYAFLANTLGVICIALTFQSFINGNIPGGLCAAIAAGFLITFGIVFSNLVDLKSNPTKNPSQPQKEDGQSISNVESKIG
jgi:hypothetical protein